MEGIPIKLWVAMGEALARHFRDRAMSPEALCRHHLLLSAVVDHWRDLPRVDPDPGLAAPAPETLSALLAEAVEDLELWARGHDRFCQCSTCDLLARLRPALASIPAPAPAPARTPTPTEGEEGACTPR